MHEHPSYERDPYLCELEAIVLSTGEEGGKPFALLDDTILFPEGGGQPSDQGLVNEIPILNVQKIGDGIRHVLSAPIKPGPARLRLDWTRRFDHMQQHTGQHLLTAVAQDRFGWSTTAFHLGGAVSDVELSAPQIPPKDLEALEDAVAMEIRAARPISAFHVSMEDYATMNVRTRGLPDGHAGDVRLVKIEGVDLNTCGGTHLRSTAEIESLHLLGTESLRGGTRVFFVAGRRARKRMGTHERRNANLRTLLGAPDEDLVSVLETKFEALKMVERRVRHLEEELATLTAEALAARPGVLLEKHFEERDTGFLQRVARQTIVTAPDKTVFLTASSQGQYFFLLAKGTGSSLDVPSIGKEIAVVLNGRGGGSSPFFQGKAESLENRHQVLAKLCAHLGNH